MPSLKDYHVDERKVWFTGGYWPKGVPHQIYDVEFAEILPLYELIVKNAKKDNYMDNDIALYVLGDYIERITFREVNEYARKFGTYLYKHVGIRKGDVVALYLPNSINYTIAFLGCQYIGAIAAGINYQYKTIELEHTFKITQAKVLVMLDSLWKGDNFNVIFSNPDVNIKKIISTKTIDFITATGEVLHKCKDFIPHSLKSIDTPSRIGDIEVVSLLSIMHNTQAQDIHIEIDPWTDPAIYFMTGGTTGLPKIAVDTHANVLGGTHAIAVWVGKSIIDIDISKMLTIATVPFFHLSGAIAILIASLIGGVKTLMFPKPPSQQLLMETINHIELPNESIMYPAAEVLYKHFNSFVDSIGGSAEFRKKYDFGNKIRFVGHGSGPLHDNIRTPFEETLNLKIKMGYGCTEGGPVSGSPYWGEDRRGTAGLPYPGFDWIIADPLDFKRGIICDGMPDPGNFGTEFIGEICISSASVFSGYLDKEGTKEENIQHWNGKRWLLTGDLGFMDKYGFITITGRKKSLVKVAGHSVFPLEIENLIATNPMVEEVAAAGLPDDQWGEAIKAWVVLKPKFREKADINSSTLMKWCKDNITIWKNPKWIEIMHEFPRAGPGKVQYATLINKDIEKLKLGKNLDGDL